MVADSRGRPRPGEAGRRNVALVAAEALVRIGLASALDSYTVLQAGTAAAGRRLLSLHRVDLTVLVLSPPLPDSSLEETCDTLLGDHPAIPALALVRPEDPPAVRLAARHGARAIFDTFIAVETLRSVIAGLDSAAPTVQPSLVRHLVDDGSAGGGAVGALRPRELAALQLLARGYTSKQIGAALSATPKAVDLLIERASQRLGASHRTQAVAIAARLGLLSTP